jgi:hypothetical protein
LVLQQKVELYGRIGKGEKDEGEANEFRTVLELPFEGVHKTGFKPVPCPSILLVGQPRRSGLNLPLM